jgi:HPt (histidine-containing phosphotransfer) domain-containing protein
MNSSLDKVYHLTRLYEYVGEEYGPVKEMVVIFTNSIPETLTKMSEALENQDYENVYKAAHSLKPSLHIFGIDDLYKTIREIESLSKNKENFNSLYLLIAQVQLKMEIVLMQLRKDFEIT